MIYEYDIENRLRSVSQGGQMLMAATYDGLGNNVHFVHSDSDMMLQPPHVLPAVVFSSKSPYGSLGKYARSSR